MSQLLSLANKISKKRISILMALLFSVSIWQGCDDAPAEALEPVTLYISAPSSLSEPLLLAAASYEELHKRVSIKINFASMKMLEEQIQLGALTDILICDNAPSLDNLEKDRYVDANSRKDLFTNSVVLYVSKNSDIHISSFEDLATSNVKEIAIGDPDSESSGYFSNQVLFYLNLDNKTKGKLLIQKDANTAFRSVENGDASVGIGLYTDVKLSDNISVIDIAKPNLYNGLIYSAVVVSNSQQKAESKKFIDWLCQKERLEPFYKRGFKELQ